jgi:hypothetical protein
MNKKDKRLRGDKDNPYHLSIGQVIIDGNNRITLIKKKDGVLTLPRETTFLQENIIDTLNRGATSEVGVTISVIKYIGSLITFFNRDPNTKIEKTTIYFLTKVTGKCEKNLAEDEVDDIVIWRSLEKTISLLKNQENTEAKIVKRVKEYLL